MKQPVKNSCKNAVVKSIEAKSKTNDSRKGTHKKRHRFNYGTSKLEADFAREFLDKLELKYVYQYEAKEIGRYFDFAVTAYPEVPFEMEVKDGINSIKQTDGNLGISFIIEVDGGYYHSDPRVVDEKRLNPMQKHNKRVDMEKDRWCGMHNYPLLRIWEKDIRENPKKVFDMLFQYIGDGEKRKKILENKKRPH